MAIVVFLLEVVEGLPFIISFHFRAPGALELRYLGPRLPKGNAGIKGYKCTKYGLCGCCHSFARGNRRNHIDFISGALGPLNCNIWGPNYSKALQGPMGYKCTKFVPRGHWSFFFLLEVAEESVFRRRKRRRRRRLSSKRRISMPCFTGIDKNLRKNKRPYR